MTKEQAEVLNIVQQVLRGVVTSCGAVAPDRIGELSASLAAHSQAPGLEPAARQMLQDLALGPGMIAAARSPKQ